MLKMSPNAVGGCLQMRWEVSKCAGRVSPNAEDVMSSFEVKLIRLISLTLSGKHLN